MSKSSIIKGEILDILKDGKEHDAFDIKAYLRRKHSDFEVTEGIFSNSFRTLTLAGKIINVERGVYKINNNADEACTNRENSADDLINKSDKEVECAENENSHEDKVCENQTCKEEKTEQCLILENKISKILIKMRDEFAGLVNGINILDADEETVKYILKVRHALDEMEKNIKYN